jgi:hypothetical protein
MGSLLFGGYENISIRQQKKEARPLLVVVVEGSTTDAVEREFSTLVTISFQRIWK